jgi:hypothetical protein
LEDLLSMAIHTKIKDPLLSRKP